MLSVFWGDFNVPNWSFPAYCKMISLQYMFGFLLCVLVKERDGYKRIA